MFYFVVWFSVQKLKSNIIQAEVPPRVVNNGLGLTRSEVNNLLLLLLLVVLFLLLLLFSSSSSLLPPIPLPLLLSSYPPPPIPLIFFLSTLSHFTPLSPLFLFPSSSSSSPSSFPPFSSSPPPPPLFPSLPFVSFCFFLATLSLFHLLLFVCAVKEAS